MQLEIGLLDRMDRMIVTDHSINLLEDRQLKGNTPSRQAKC